MEAIAALWKNTQIRILLSEGDSLIKTTKFLVLSWPTHYATSLNECSFTFFVPIIAMWSWRKNWAWIVSTLNTNWCHHLLGIFFCSYQFKLLPELFQDEEKVISPTSATPSGRVPLSRTAVKPAKARPGQTSKEHKKTVGHQVSLKMQI